MTDTTLTDTTMYGNVSELDIIQAINDSLSKKHEDVYVTMDELYNPIFSLHMSTFPQNTPAKHILESIVSTHSHIKSSPGSILYKNHTHHLYEAIILMGTFKLFKKTTSSLDSEPIKQCIRNAWERYCNSFKDIS